MARRATDRQTRQLVSKAARNNNRRDLSYGEKPLGRRHLLWLCMNRLRGYNYNYNESYITAENE